MIDLGSINKPNAKLAVQALQEYDEVAKAAILSLDNLAARSQVKYIEIRSYSIHKPEIIVDSDGVDCDPRECYWKSQELSN